jgi:hypothetical protein
LRTPSTPHRPGPAADFKTKRIEDIRVGERVLTSKQGNAQSAQTKVDPATWRRVKLLAFQRWADGTLDDIHIDTLQPPEWLTQNDVRVGAEVPLPLDLVEMGLPEDLRGEVLAVEDCPAIAPGPGRVVLTTVNHLNSYVLELTVEDARGKQEKVRPTGFHKFYRPLDGKWVSAEDLKSADKLLGQQGLLRVMANTRVPGVHRVYNLTVEGQHVYRVCSLGALVHNTGCFPANPDDLTHNLGVPPKVGVTPDGTPRMTWEPNGNTRIRYESHPGGLTPGDAGFSPRHHGAHYHVETKPEGLSWSQAKRQGQITKVEPPGYSPGSGTGFLPAESFPGN